MTSPLRAAVDKLCRRFALAELYVFGSRAQEVAARVRMDQGSESRSLVSQGDCPASDVDVGVRPLPGTRLDVDALVDLAGELEPLFEAHRVDVVLLPTAKPFSRWRSSVAS